MSAYLENLFSLKDQTAVVIGGTGVLGGALAVGLARAGAFVVVAGRGEDRGLERVKEIESHGGQAKFLPVVADDRASHETLLAEVVKLRGGVDILVNCAGVNNASAYQDLKDEDWERVIRTNLTGTHYGCQIFGRHMIESKKGGSIINIGSVTSDKPLSRVIVYSASKEAVVNLTRNVAREYAPHNIRVNCICPGFFPAEQNRKVLDEQRVKNIMSGTPMNRFGEPEELIGTAILLSSKTAGSYITGAIYYVDGGFTAMRF